MDAEKQDAKQVDFEVDELTNELEEASGGTCSSTGCTGCANEGGCAGCTGCKEV